ncbi:MAG: repressor LexA [Gammaproteobacteria bacterium]|jgi:repressor LexA
MDDLTRKQKQVYEYLCSRAAKGDAPPTLDELCAELSLRSRGSIHKHIRALVDAGLVHPMAGKQRGVRLVGSADEGGVVPFDPDLLPFVGRIAAGVPLEAVNTQEQLLVPPILRTDRACFVLKVKGDSMIDEGILDGDLVVIESRDTARNGEIVVALIDGEDATLKRIVQRPEVIELWPANPSLSVMKYSPERVSIQGAVVGQMRTYT